MKELTSCLQNVKNPKAKTLLSVFDKLPDNFKALVQGGRHQHAENLRWTSHSQDLNVCVVGKGKVQKNAGTEIDACDFVIRANTIQTALTPDEQRRVHEQVGKKTSMIMTGGISVQTELAKRHGFPIFQWHRKTKYPSVWNMKEKYNKKLMNDKRFTRTGGRSAAPSSGFMAVCIALKYFGRVKIAGFAPSRGNNVIMYNDGRVNCLQIQKRGLYHGLPIEHKLLAILVKEGYIECLDGNFSP
jgi:hypothetical protein